MVIQVYERLRETQEYIKTNMKLDPELDLESKKAINGKTLEIQMSSAAYQTLLF